MVSDLEVRIEQTGAQIEIGYLPTIDADPAQMRQLFQNLLSNAMKFQPADSVPEVVRSRLRNFISWCSRMGSDKRGQ